MPNKYTFRYTREQRAFIDVRAETEDIAYFEANRILQAFTGPREHWDESDDPGELELEESGD